MSGHPYLGRRKSQVEIDRAFNRRMSDIVARGGAGGGRGLRPSSTDQTHTNTEAPTISNVNSSGYAGGVEVSTIGWSSIENTKMLFIESPLLREAPSAASAHFKRHQHHTAYPHVHTRLSLMDHLPETATFTRVYEAVETVGQFNTPIKRRCCKKPNQKGYTFDCRVLDAEGKEVIHLVKGPSSTSEATLKNKEGAESSAEIFLTIGTESVGLIVQEDGFEANEMPFKYTIHDAVGPLLLGIRADVDPVTTWSIVTYGPESRPVAKISNKWFNIGDRHLVEDGFGLEFERHIETEFKGYLIAFLLTLYFRFSHSCHVVPRSMSKSGPPKLKKGGQQKAPK